MTQPGRQSPLAVLMLVAMVMTGTGTSRCSSPGGGLSVGRIGILVALYPAVWGVGKLATGALPDRWGRKWLIAAGMWAAEEVCSARFGAGQLFTRARENGLQPSGRNSDWVAGAPGRCG
jgi:MFS family permease